MKQLNGFECLNIWIRILQRTIHNRLPVGCSHQRAWEYFIESIHRPTAFLATHCEPNSMLAIKNQTVINCDKNISAYMGYNADTR